jgi:hypothetical protein
MEPDQIDVLTAPVFRGLEKIDHTLEAGLPSQMWSDVGKTDRLDRIDVYRTAFHAIVAAHLHVGTLPDSDAAIDFPAPNPLA